MGYLDGTLVMFQDVDDRLKIWPATLRGILEWVISGLRQEDAGTPKYQDCRLGNDAMTRWHEDLLGALKK